MHDNPMERMERHLSRWQAPPARTLGSMDTTPRLDPLRGAHLRPPYYGVPSLGHIPMTTAFDRDGRVELTSQVRQREQELQGMYTLLNAGVPINRLPIELLVEIFVQLQVGDIKMGWLNVLRVCRHWFVIGSTTAKLWRDLHVETRTNLLHTGLARSQGADLSIRITPFALLFPLAEVTGLISPHLNRLRDLRIGIISPKCLPAFVAFMENEMPSLRFLQVFAQRADGLPEAALNLSPVSFPQLRELHTSGFNIYPNFAIASQLHMVSVNDCLGEDPNLDTATLVDAVRKMENAKDLSMRHIQVCDVGSAAMIPSSDDKVALNQLQDVAIYADGPVLKAVLSAIIIPPTATVNLTCPFTADAPQGDTPSFSLALPEDRSCLPIISSIVALYVASIPGEHSLGGYTTPRAIRPSTCFGPQVEFSIDVSDPEDEFNIDPDAIGLGDLVNVFRDAPLQSLDITTTSTVVASTDWRHLFSTFPTLREFDLHVEPGWQSVENGLPGADTIFSALDPGCIRTTGSPHLGEQEHPSKMQADVEVLCPDLQHINLEGLASSDTDAVLATIKASLENRKRALGGIRGRIERIDLRLVGLQTAWAQPPGGKATLETGLSPLVGFIFVSPTDEIW